jgi:integrase
LEKHFGSRQIESITQKEIEEFTQELLKELTPGTVKNILALFRGIFNKCKEWEIITEYARCPVKITKAVKLENQRERFLTYKEASIIFDVLQLIDCNVYMIAKISLHTGMRLGEITNLKIHNINCETGNIYIENGKSGKRSAYISDELRAPLKTPTVLHKISQ